MADLFLGRPRSRSYPKFNIRRDIPMLELRYDKSARLISAVIMAAYATMIAAIQLIAIGTILHAMLGWGMTAGILAGGLVVLTYTF